VTGKIKQYLDFYTANKDFVSSLGNQLTYLLLSPDSKGLVLDHETSCRNQVLVSRQSYSWDNKICPNEHRGWTAWKHKAAFIDTVKWWRNKNSDNL